MKWSCCILIAVVLLASVVLAEGEIWEEDEKEVLIRSERGAKKDPCRYEKGPWSECDASTNTRSRQLTLKKKSDDTSSTCEATKTIQKKCKKACRYEKGTWSQCNEQNEMVRTDTLKEKSDPSCEQSRSTTKKCKNKAGRPNKANKACRYEKGTWSECNEKNEMVRTDTLKANSDPSCEQSRSTTKKCKNKNGRTSKAQEGSRRNRQP